MLDQYYNDKHTYLDEVDSSGFEGGMSSNEQLLKEDEARSTSTGMDN